MNNDAVTPLDDGAIGYLFISVTNFPEMLSFYRDTLGLELTYLDDGSCAFFRLKKGQPQIALISGRQSPPDRQNHWFIVINVDDVRVTVSRLTTAGVEVGEIRDVPYGEAAQFYDPEGNIIEVHQLKAKDRP
jgi:predicted enzyme related to lactoylglutathione lyase